MINLTKLEVFNGWKNSVFRNNITFIIRELCTVARCM